MIKQEYFEQIEKAAAYIRGQFGVDTIPSIALMMGTGLSSIVNDLVDPVIIDYIDIPYFPISTVQSHNGQLVFGSLNGKKILVLAGRWHYYEGYSTKQLTFPIRVMKSIGVETILFTNVSGSVNASFKAGDLVVISDHINFIPDHPLRGHNDIRLGPRFPDMMKTYDSDLQELIIESAKEGNLSIHSGIYLALQGPSLETPAEYMFIHKIGADLVGMSTVPEVIVAKHAGLRIAAISIVSNQCFPPEIIQETTIESVIKVANNASLKLNELFKILMPKL